MDGVAPPGMEHVVKRLKQEKGVTNPWAIAWSIYEKKGSACGEMSADELEAEIASIVAESGLASYAGTPANAIRVATEFAVRTGELLTQATADYVEAPGGTNCATCIFAKRLPGEVTGWKEDVAECAVMHGRISLRNGCCALWKAHPDQLRAMKD